MNDHDRRMLDWVRAFNPYDLYSKGHDRPDVAGPDALLPGPDRRVLPAPARLVIGGWHALAPRWACSRSPRPSPKPEMPTQREGMPPARFA